MGAVAGELGRHDPADSGSESDALAGNGGWILHVFERGMAGQHLADGLSGVQPGRSKVRYYVLLDGCGVHLFLYGHDIPTAEPSGDAAETGWIYTRYPAG